jgi:hypothetical protein
MGNEHSYTDGVTRVLLECEATLRKLHEENRLTDKGLQAFVELSAQVIREMERRRGVDRRMAARSTPERRAPMIVPEVEPI